MISTEQFGVEVVVYKNVSEDEVLARAEVVVLALNLLDAESIVFGLFNSPYTRVVAASNFGRSSATHSWLKFD